VRNPTLKYKTQLVEIKQSVKCTNRYMNCLCCIMHMCMTYLYFIMCMYMTFPISTYIYLQKTRVFQLSATLKLLSLQTFTGIYHINLQPVTATNLCHIYHVINEASPITYACPSCIHHHTTWISLNHIITIPYIRVLFTQPTNQHIPYLDTTTTIPRMPQPFTIP
jgi:hypothetical protein